MRARGSSRSASSASRSTPDSRSSTRSVKPASVGQPYTETLTAKQVTTLNPPTGTDVQASWSVESGALPPGLALSPQGLLTGTPTTEGSWGFVIRAQNGSTLDSKEYALTVRQPLSVKSPFGPCAAAEQRGRDSPREDLHRSGRKRPLHLGARVGRIAPWRRTRRDQRALISWNAADRPEPSRSASPRRTARGA